MSSTEEIADLLGQCGPEELADILRNLADMGTDMGAELANIMGADAVPPVPPSQPAPGEDPEPAGAPFVPVPPTAKTAVAPGVAAVPAPAAAAAPLVPVRPAAAKPGPAGRRPQPAGASRQTAPAGEPAPVSMGELKAMLADHSMSVLSEAQKMLAAADVPGRSEGEDMGVLAGMLADRDDEVKQLEEQLAGLQAELATKDRRVADLCGELEPVLREVGHRQLDLEVQQQKLEERVRSNAELEQVQRSLATRLEEVSLSASHAVLDLQMSQTSPGSFSACGAYPWALRQQRLAQ